MATDITLDDAGGAQITISAFTTKVFGPDLVLDSPDRRKVPDGTRRALVHNADDGLTLNWDNDYPGGITLNGVVSINPIEVYEISPQPPFRFIPWLKVNGGIQFETSYPDPSGGPFSVVKESVYLQDLIDELRAKVSNLESRIAALEGR